MTKPKPTERASDQELLETTVDLITAGLTAEKISRYLADRFTNAPKPAKAGELIERAKDAIRQRTEEHGDVALEIAISRLNDLYARTLRIQDYKTALAIQREINHLLALRAEAKRARQQPEPIHVQAGEPIPFKKAAGALEDAFRSAMRPR